MVTMELVKKETSNHFKAKDSGQEYGKVILTLTNCLLPEEKLTPTPSFKDGLDAETEADLRIIGCDLMQTAGILLRLPQVAMATAQVLFQRFYYSKSFVRQNFEVTGMGCLYLASKIEEAPRRIRDVINVYHHIKQVNSQKNLTPMVLDQNYISLKSQVIKAERRVLKELGFAVHVKHPHKLIVLYLQVIGLETKQALMQMAWNYMNDSLRTDVFVRYQPETVACACIYLTARKLKIPLPRSPPWFSIFKVSEEDIQDVCLRILRLYKRNKPKSEELERKVQDLCKKFEESRLRSKPGFNNAVSGNNTPISPAQLEKKLSPKRSHSDRSRSRSDSSSPRHKRYKRSRSRSYDKYKKSRSRRSRSKSPIYKSYKDKRYRSRSRSYERDHHKSEKYVSDRYKEDRYYDRYRRDDDRYRRDDEKYRKDDDKYRREDDYKYKKDDDLKYRKDEEVSKYRKEDDKYKREDENNVRTKKDDAKSKREDDNDKYRKDDEKFRREDERRRDEDSHKHKKDKNSIKEEDVKKVKTKHSSSKHKNSGEKKKKKKHYDIVDDDDFDIVEIVHVKKDKKSK